jgi:hypothetical protein
MTALLEPPMSETTTRWAVVERDGRKTVRGPFLSREEAVAAKAQYHPADVVLVEPGSELDQELTRREEQERARQDEYLARMAEACEQQQRETERQAEQYRQAEEAKAEAKRQIDRENHAAAVFTTLRDALRFPWQQGHGEKVADIAERAGRMKDEAFSQAEKDWRAGPAYQALAELRPMRDSLAKETDRARTAADKAEAEYQSALAGDDAAAVVKTRAKRDAAGLVARAAASSLADFQRGRFDPADDLARQDWHAKHAAAVDGLRRRADDLARPQLAEALASLLAAVPGAALGGELRRLVPYDGAHRLTPPMPPE